MGMTKKVILGVSVLMALMLFLTSCTFSISRGGYEALQSRLNASQLEIDTLKANMTALQGSYNDLQADYGNLLSSYEGLLDDYEDSLKRLQQSTLENPTWSELEEFLRLDDTDTIPYIEDSFDCSGFAITLRDRAWRYGMRSAYVEIGFSEGEGHALSVFETTDKGLIYIDDTEADQIAYVEIGQPYGLIHLDAVKSEHIACNGSPDEFWGSLTYTTHPDPFSYDYYLDYYRRAQFYEESVVAYNEAVNAYNGGSSEWSRSRLTRWLENIEALGEDLGSIFYELGGTVENVEIYWN
jgi:hypothetical protein